MNDKFIAIILHGNTVNYPVYIYTGNGSAFGRCVAYEEIIDYVLDMSEKCGIDNIKINSSESFAAPLVSSIKSAAAMKYNNKNIEIEVIRE